MCDHRAGSTKTARWLGGRPIEVSFSRFLQERIPAHQFQPGVCFMPGCCTPLPKWQIDQGRYMCEHCFLSVVDGGPYSNCLMCGDPLPPNQVRLQARQPRELIHAMHQGECIEYHNALVGITLGIIPPTKQIAYQPRPADPLLGYDSRQPQYIQAPARRLESDLDGFQHLPAGWKPN